MLLVPHDARHLPWLRNEIMAAAVRCLAPVGDKCGEAALWSASENAVYWTDINRFLIHRFQTESKTVRSWIFDEPVVALSLTRAPDWLLVALASRLIYWRPESDERRPHGFILPGSPEVRLNDGRSDPVGNFWVGSMKNNMAPDGSLTEAGKGAGILYRITPQGEVSEWRTGLGISNTLCWSPDATRFYFGDTMENAIYAYDYDRTKASISGEHAFFAGYDRGAPDGSAIDSEGSVWNCRFGGACVVRVSPTGEVQRIVEMPVTNVTTCCFGGPGLKTLYITTASILAPPSDRLAGSLFSIEAGVAGLPENQFAAAP